MNKHGNYELHLYGMKDYVVEYKKERYVFCPVIAQRLKAIDTVTGMYRRWFQLCQFTLDIKTVYGIAALNILPEKQTKKGHSSSLKVIIHITKGEDSLIKVD